MSISKLPFELIWLILDFATQNPIRSRECQTMSTFSTIGETAKDKLLDDALRTKASVFQVNRVFRAASRAFMYEDIRVRHGADALATVLEASKECYCDPDDKDELHSPCVALGCRVRRICIYPAEEDDIAQLWAGTLNRHALRILRSCPHVEVLSRANFASRRPPKTLQIMPPLGLRRHEPTTSIRASLTFGLPPAELTEVFAVEELQLTSLTRVDWVNEVYSAETDTPRMTLPLPRFIWTLPSLKILCINGSSFPNLPPALSGLNVRRIHLPELHTVRLCSYNAIGMGLYYPRANEVNFPALRRLVVGVQGAFYSAYEGVLSTERLNITTLELGCDTSFLRLGTLRSLLRFYCNVEELRIPVCTTAVDVQTITIESFPSVRRILYTAAMPEKDPENEFIRENLWRQVKGHLKQFTASKSKFENVKDITLIGKEWLPIVCDDRFKELEAAINENGVKVEKCFA